MASSKAVIGVTSDGLTMQVLPAARAAATCQVINRIGKLKGRMLTITPSGSRTTRFI
ncbi:hypothetical protein D3C86_1602370 [compost metagenome]